MFFFVKLGEKLVVKYYQIGGDRRDRKTRIDGGGGLLEMIYRSLIDREGRLGGLVVLVGR